MSYTTPGGALAASRPRIICQHRAPYLRLARLSVFSALLGASLALGSVQWHLIGLALYHSAALAAAGLGLAAAVARQPGTMTGLLPVALLGSLAALEPWLPATLLNMLQALTP